MRKFMRRVFVAVVLVLLVAVVGAFTVLPGIVDRSLNPTRVSGPYTVSETAATLHANLFVADLHADSLLWNRDLLERNTYGHADLPRMQDGNVSLQAFTVVTKTPRGMNNARNDDTTDNITALAFFQRWPVAAWSSLKARALHQATKLHETAARSNGQLIVIESKQDIAQFIEDKKTHPKRVAGFLGIEGTHPLEGDIANVDALYDAGFRMFGLTHFFDTEVGGSAHGVEQGGLTPFGREVLRRMEELHIIVDLAHASPALIDDVLDATTRPVLVSHTGVRGTCGGPRNLTDGQVRRIAQNGGLIGIGFWPGAVCGNDADAIVRAMRYVTDLVGVDHVALGSDYDGTVHVPFDVSGVAKITEALLNNGFTEAETRKIMGGNVLRFLQANFPDA